MLNSQLLNKRLKVVFAIGNNTRFNCTTASLLELSSLCVICVHII